MRTQIERERNVRFYRNRFIRFFIYYFFFNCHGKKKKWKIAGFTRGKICVLPSNFLYNHLRRHSSYEQISNKQSFLIVWIRPSFLEFKKYGIGAEFQRVDNQTQISVPITTPRFDIVLRPQDRQLHLESIQDL